MKRAYPVLILFILVTLLVLISSFKKTGNTVTERIPTTPVLSQVSEGSSSAAILGVRTKSSSCISHDALPDQHCTPGQILPVSAKEICVRGYAKSVRNVTERVKKQVYEEYGITEHSAGQYEVDHLISLELGGSNDISNLWPEPANPVPGFHEKDKLENYLHKQVCDGTIPLSSAQEKIAHNWLEVYKQIR